MTPPPDGDHIVAWRLDPERYRASWDSGEGAYRFGGRWNSAGLRAVYCSIDPATAILEVAVHNGFKMLDTTPHVLTAITVPDPSHLYVVQPEALPNPHWISPGEPSAGQQAYGDDLLAKHGFVLIPSAVSKHSWNLIFDPQRASGLYALQLQERFALDTRLHPPT